VVGGTSPPTWQQKNTADRRSEWWRRTAWGFERSLSDDNAEAKLGLRVLDTLIESRLATKADSNVAQVIAEHMARDEDNDDEGRHRGGRANRGDPETST